MDRAVLVAAAQHDAPQLVQVILHKSPLGLERRRARRCVQCATPHMLVAPSSTSHLRRFCAVCTSGSSRGYRIASSRACRWARWSACAPASAPRIARGDRGSALSACACSFMHGHGRGAEGVAPPFARTPRAFTGGHPTLRACWLGPGGRMGSHGYPEERHAATVAVAPGRTAEVALTR